MANEPVWKLLGYNSKKEYDDELKSFDKLFKEQTGMTLAEEAEELDYEDALFGTNRFEF